MYSSNGILQKVDVEYALKNRKILTQVEFDLTFPGENYSDYCNKYYKIKIYRFFDRHSYERWFIEKFSGDFIRRQKILDNFERFKELDQSNFPTLHINQEITNRIENIAGKYLVLHNIPNNYGSNDVKELLSRFDGIIDFDITKTSYTSPSRRVFVSLSPNIDHEEIMEKIRERTSGSIDTQFFVISDEIVKKTIWIDLRDKDIENLRKILKMLNEQLKTNISFESTNVDTFITFLRVVFNYCYYCTRQYESEIEMFYDCGDYHVRDIKVQPTIFDRKQKILTLDRDFSFLLEQTLEKELEAYIIRTSETIFTCGNCEKNFESSEYVLQHFKTRHEGFCDDMQKNLDFFKKFIRQIDMNLLVHFDGNENNFLPSFAVHENEGQAIKYDLPLVYSGEFKNDK